MKLPAPAKLNLFLQITGRRPDGYHALQSMFCVLDWGDTISLECRDDGAIVRVGALPGVDPEQDLAVRAARLLQTESGCRLGADIGIEKRIPMGGGMGGGSSDAATVLHGLNVLWNLHWSSERLAALGLQLGADVPFFIGGTHAWAEGAGEVLTPVELPQKVFLLARPDSHADTGQLFADKGLTRDSEPVKISDFIEGRVHGNAFEPVLRRRDSAVEQMFALLSAVGTPRLTGTGSVVFVEFSDWDSAELALQALPPGVNAWLAASADRAPLLAALTDYN